MKLKSLIAAIVLLLCSSVAGQDWAAVVRVEGEPNVDGQGINVGSGTLVMLGENGTGYVLTAKHVARGSNRMTVVWQSGFRATGSVIGRGERYDTAVIHVAVPPNPAVIPLGQESVQPGVTVVAAGYAHGRTWWSITSRLDGYVESNYGQIARLAGNAPSGVSGGPMVVNGTVVGVISCAGHGYSYAEPCQPIRNLFRAILPHGIVASADRARLTQGRSGYG